MKKLTTSKQILPTQHTLLCLIGQRCQNENLLEPLHQLVRIDQKSVVHSPVDKLIEQLLLILLAGESVSQINSLLAQEVAVLNSFGRTCCADQSTVQRTLSACTSQNVAQLQQAHALMFERHSRIRHHNFHKRPLVLDIDLTGLPASKHYEGSCKGYFADCKPGTYGRQLHRVSASQYNLIVYQQVFAGNTTSSNLANFKTLLSAAFKVLGLKAKYKRRVLVRLDGGYGNAPIINYLLEEGYQFVVKVGNAPRAKALCQSVSDWQVDGCHSRELGEVTAAHGYASVGKREVQLIGVRHQPPPPTKTKPAATAPASLSEAGPGYKYNVLAVCLEDLKWLQTSPAALEVSPLLAQVHFYDGRASIETASIKGDGDKQGLKLVKRRKFSLAGQEILILLAQLAHNLVMWAKDWLELELKVEEGSLAGYYLQRLVRDLLTIAGQVVFRAGQIVKVRMNGRNHLARKFGCAIARCFAKSGIIVKVAYG